MAKELSIFVDESGDRGGKARYYLLTLVFHDQADGIAEAVTGYEAMLAYFSSFVRRLPSPMSRSSIAAANSKTRQG